MRSRGLSFADAVKLLDGDSELVTKLGQMGGVAAGTVTVASAGTVDFFALRDQVVRWGQAAVRAWRDRTSGLSRYDRTDRLIAAHSVIVLVAFYEALGEWLTGHRIDLDAAGLKATDQARLGGADPASGDFADVVQALLRSPAPFPSPELPFESLLQSLDSYYRYSARKVGSFLGGLRAFEGVYIDAASRDLASRALRSYTASYRRLAAEIPEFRLWAEMIDARATRQLIRAAIDALHEEHAAVDAVRGGLIRRYEAQLEKPILSAAHAAGDLALPTLREGYREPSGRVATAQPADTPATGLWWDTHGRAIPDVQDFLVACLTAPQATDVPIVVLGHPGSGKSVLTRVLAARLSRTGFLPVRVELRNVRADSPVQRQIEEALYLLLGETVSWPDLVRRAGTALPVVMMDGFDELLQATGQNWADYLEQLQDFQQREAELGRPLAVLVTSRTVVADRARFPAGSTVVRLDDFGDEQITAWLRGWNALNAPRLAALGLRPLPVEVALAHRELATQPLLLLLLALYDGRANELQRRGGGLGRVDLYERLFTSFFERQVDKLGAGLSPEQWDAEVAAEWRRLSAVAVAMHNRGQDVLLEPELEADLRHLLSEEDRAPGPGSRPLTAGQLLVGRFFFVHESLASRGTGAAERSFEFLHATFGEFLAARRIVTALTDLAEDRAYLRRRPGATLDAGFLYALTSFATIARRQPLWSFCQGLLARLDAETRHGCRALVLELLAEAGHPHPTWSHPGYEPKRPTQAARQATFSANLVCLAVLLADGPVDTSTLVGEPVAVNWRRLALLWMGQLDPEDARSLWQTLRVEWNLETDPTRLMVRVEDGAPVSVIASLPWPTEDRPAPWPDARDVALPADSVTGRLLRKSAMVQTGIDSRELFYVMIPFWRRFGDLSFPARGEKWRSDARALLEVLLGSGQRVEYFVGELAGSVDVWEFLEGHLRPDNRPRHRLRAAMAEYDEAPRDGA